MKRIKVFVVLSVLVVCLLQYTKADEKQKETDEAAALKLAAAFIHKLESNTPFVKSDDSRFFGNDFGMMAGYLVYDRLGYLEEDSHQFKVKPKRSALGELIRLNRDKIIVERSEELKRKNLIQILMFPARDSYVIPSRLGAKTRKLPESPTASKPLSELTTLVTVMIGDGENENFVNPLMVMNFFLMKTDGTGVYYICPVNTYINGKSLAERIGFTYNTGKPAGIRDDDENFRKLKKIFAEETEDGPVFKTEPSGF